MVGGGASPPPRLGVGLISVIGMSSLLVVEHIAPASEDGDQLCGMKRPCILTVRESAETSAAVEEPGCRQAATRLADGEGGDERAVRRRILLHQALQGFGHLMDGMGWQDLKSLRQLLIGNWDSTIRDALKECAYPFMRRQPIVLPESSALSAATIDRCRSRSEEIESFFSLP